MTHLLFTIRSLFILRLSFFDRWNHFEPSALHLISLEFQQHCSAKLDLSHLPMLPFRALTTAFNNSALHDYNASCDLIAHLRFLDFEFICLQYFIPLITGNITSSICIRFSSPTANSLLGRSGYSFTFFSFNTCITGYRWCGVPAISNPTAGSPHHFTT